MPEVHRAFLSRALPLLEGESWLLAVAAGGSFVSGGLDEYSDLDLVLVTRPEAWRGVLEARAALAGRLGPLLASFTGEHVGEPRLLVCLYGPPLLHVDLKLVSLIRLYRELRDDLPLPELLSGGRVEREVGEYVASVLRSVGRSPAQ